MKRFHTIKADDFFKVQEKDLCKEFEGDLMSHSSCVGSASDLSQELMRSAGMFGDLKKGVEIRLNRIPMKIKKEKFDNIISKEKGKCHVWNIPPGASSEKKEFAEKMVKSCLIGVERFKKELNL